MAGYIDESEIKQAVIGVVNACAKCQARLDAANVSVLGHHEDLWFLSLTCFACRNRSLVAALVQKRFGVTITDLTPDELARFQNAPRVAADDVLDIHQFLDVFDGNFRGLFER
jgi:hypothetical protein